MFAGNHLTELMELKKMSVAQLVHALGWSSNRQYYQFVEGNPTAKTLELVANYFNVSIDYFFDRGDYAPSPLSSVSSDSSNLYERLLLEKDSRINALERLIDCYQSRDKCGTNNHLSSSENSCESY